MNCSRCGTALAPNSGFCGACGTPTSAPRPGGAPAPAPGHGGAPAYGAPPGGAPAYGAPPPAYGAPPPAYGAPPGGPGFGQPGAYPPPGYPPPGSPPPGYPPPGAPPQAPLPPGNFAAPPHGYAPGYGPNGPNMGPGPGAMPPHMQHAPHAGGPPPGPHPAPFPGGPHPGQSGGGYGAPLLPYELVLQQRIKRYTGHVYLAPHRLYFVCQSDKGGLARAIGMGVGGLIGGAIAGLATPGHGQASGADEATLQRACAEAPGSLVMDPPQIKKMAYTIWSRGIWFDGKTYALPSGLTKELQAELGRWCVANNVAQKGLVKK